MNADIGEAVEKAGAWMEIEGVEGVAQGHTDGEDCILVLVSSDVAARQIPARYLSFPVKIQFTPKIVAQDRPRPRG